MSRNPKQIEAELRYASKREKKPVMCRLDAEQMARLDKARGRQARGAFLLQALLDKLPER
jgi:hypothetical protein